MQSGSRINGGCLNAQSLLEVSFPYSKSLLV